MKNVYFVILTVCFGVVFGRVSNKHSVSTSSYDLSYSGQKGVIYGFNGSDDSDLRWKRRHKETCLRSVY
jgi:hypothetical protein